MLLSLGFDPSTKGAAFALMELNYNARHCLEFGRLDDDHTIAEKLRNTSGYIVLGIETPKGGIGHGHKKTEYGARKRAENVMQAARVAEFIRATALAYNYQHVYALSSGETRRQCGLRGETTDAMVSTALRSLVPTWPKKSNNHVRDAALVALAAGMRHAVMHGW